MSEEKKEEGLTLDKRTMDVLVANIIPTSKYFEVRFDHMQEQIDDLKVDLKDFRGDVDKRFDNIKTDMDKRFEQVDKRFEQVDKRFEQVDKRFEQVDKRLEQIIASIDRLGDKLENRDESQRSFTLRMFTIAIGISVIGALGTFLKSLGVF
jgi:methyl-accepting chemotaxis protein